MGIIEEIRDWEKQLELATKARDWLNVSRIRNVLGHLESRRGKHKAALEHHAADAAACKQNRDLLGEAVAHGNIGACYMDMEKWTDAQEQFEMHLDQACTKHSLIEQYRAHFSLARLHLRVSQSLDDENDALIVKSLAAAKASNRSAVNTAETMFNDTNDGKIVKDVSNSDSKQHLAAAYEQLCEIYQAVGEKAPEQKSDLQQISIQYYQYAKELYKQLEDELAVGRTCHNIGMLYCDIGIYKKAVSYVKKDLELCREHGSGLALAEVYSSLGSVHHQFRHYDEAGSCHKQALIHVRRRTDEIARQRDLRAVIQKRVAETTQAVRREEQLKQWKKEIDSQEEKLKSMSPGTKDHGSAVEAICSLYGCYVDALEEMEFRGCKDEMISQARKSLEIATTVKDTDIRLYVESVLYLADAYWENSQWDRVVSTVESALPNVKPEQPVEYLRLNVMLIRGLEGQLQSKTAADSQAVDADHGPRVENLVDTCLSIAGTWIRERQEQLLRSSERLEEQEVDALENMFELSEKKSALYTDNALVASKMKEFQNLIGNVLHEYADEESDDEKERTPRDASDGFGGLLDQDSDSDVDIVSPDSADGIHKRRRIDAVVHDGKASSRKRSQIDISNLVDTVDQDEELGPMERFVSKDVTMAGPSPVFSPRSKGLRRVSKRRSHVRSSIRRLNESRAKMSAHEAAQKQRSFGNSLRELGSTMVQERATVNSTATFLRNAGMSSQNGPKKSKHRRIDRMIDVVDVDMLDSDDDDHEQPVFSNTERDTRHDRSHRRSSDAVDELLMGAQSAEREQRKKPVRKYSINVTFDGVGSVSVPLGGTNETPSIRWIVDEAKLGYLKVSGYQLETGAIRDNSGSVIDDEMSLYSRHFGDLTVSVLSQEMMPPLDFYLQLCAERSIVPSKATIQRLQAIGSAEVSEWNVSDTSVGDECQGLLLRTLHAHQSLCSIDLCGVPAGEEFCKEWHSCCKNWSQLKSLALRSIHVRNPFVWRNLLLPMQGLKLIERLDLSHNTPLKYAGQTLANSLKCMNLKGLRLAGCNLGEKWIEGIMESVAGMGELELIDLRWNAFSQASRQIILSTLTNSIEKCSVLLLADTQLSTYDVSLLGKALAQRSALNNLRVDLSGNELGDSGMRHLLSALPENVRELRLASCGLSAVTAVPLFRMCGRFKRLEVLDVSGNNLGPQVEAGITSYMTVLSCGVSALEELNLNSTGLSDEAILAIVRHCSACATISRLHVGTATSPPFLKQPGGTERRWRTVAAKGPGGLAASLRACRHLVYLDLSGLTLEAAARAELLASWTSVRPNGVMRGIEGFGDMLVLDVDTDTADEAELSFRNAISQLADSFEESLPV